MYVEESSEPQDLRMDSRHTSGVLTNSDVHTPVSSILVANPIREIAYNNREMVFSSNTDARFIPITNSGVQCIFGGANSNGLNELANAASALKKKKPNNVRSPSNTRRGSPRSVNAPKNYTNADLALAVELVINGTCQPVEAINRFNIPRRTFFRHLKKRREELGQIVKKASPSSSRSSSREASPGPSSSFNSSVLGKRYQSSNTENKLKHILYTISAGQVKTETIVKLESDLPISNSSTESLTLQHVNYDSADSNSDESISQVLPVPSQSDNSLMNSQTSIAVTISTDN